MAKKGNKELRMQVTLPEALNMFQVDKEAAEQAIWEDIHHTYIKYAYAAPPVLRIQVDLCQLLEMLCPGCRPAAVMHRSHDVQVLNYSLVITFPSIRNDGRPVIQIYLQSEGQADALAGTGTVPSDVLSDLYKRASVRSNSEKQVRAGRAATQVILSCA